MHVNKFLRNTVMTQNKNNIDHGMDEFRPQRVSQISLRVMITWIVSVERQYYESCIFNGLQCTKSGTFPSNW